MDMEYLLKEYFLITCKICSADGPHSNVLKFKPPLCFNKEDLNIAIDALDKALDALTKPQ